MSEDHGEMCGRCGEIDEDRRTLWMACFYQMNELGIPFIEKNLWSVNEDTLKKTIEQVPCSTKSYDPKTKKYGRDKKFTIEREHFKSDEELDKRSMYTLRVCKKCRGDWLGMIKEWFSNCKKETLTGTGVFLRKHGSVVELTEDEIRTNFPNGEYVTSK